MKLKDLKKNERNPRTISQEKKEGLKKSVQKFGDLGGIIYNIRSKRLVGGHQRSSVLSPSDTIKVVTKYDTPTNTGTVAEGYVTHKGEKYSYREVDWDQATETSAMIAANKHGGEWDKDLLKIALTEIKDVSITGFNAVELKSMNIKLSPMNIEKPEPKEEQIDTENPNENVVTSGDTFEDTDEQESENMKNKRFVIIIDCKDDEVKQALREKLRQTVEDSGAKFF